MTDFAAERRALARELEEVENVLNWVQTELRGVGRGISTARTAIAAAAATETYRVMDGMDFWQNETSVVWQSNLELVWAFLAGDDSQYYPISRAVGEYLLSPLNHNEGQDGPDDFDRPQTVASYSALLSVLHGGEDFMFLALSRMFEAIDLKFDSQSSDASWIEVQRAADFIRRVVANVVTALGESQDSLSNEVLQGIKH